MRKVLVTGGGGQVGLALARQVWPSDVKVVFPSRSQLDLTDANSIKRFFDDHHLSAVINCAAYTAVDAAEDDASDAFLCNAQGPAWLAEAAHRAGSEFIQVSTDYVFNGMGSTFYTEDSPVSPISVYGASKLAGEIAVRAAHPKSVVLRTAWVVSVHRNNFLKTMLRLGSERTRLSIVSDQYGCPTSAEDIASALKTIVVHQMENTYAPDGIFHFVNNGATNWCDFAKHIFRLAKEHGFSEPEVHAISSADYPTKAKRPSNSRLSTDKIRSLYGIEPRPWEIATKEIVDEIMNHRSAEIES